MKYSVEAPYDMLSIMYAKEKPKVMPMARVRMN